MNHHPDMMPGVFFAIASIFAAMLLGIALFGGFDRGDFWRGAFIGCVMIFGVLGLTAGVVFLAVKMSS